MMLKNRTTFKVVMSFVTIFAILFILVGCNNVKSLELDKTTLTLVVGQSDTVKATVKPEDAKVEWISDKPEIATVDAGKITAVSKGTAVITATAGKKTATVTVTVNPKTFTVMFSMNGGSAVQPQSVVDGAKAAKPTDPTKENYVFSGWYKEEALTNAYDFNAAVTANTILYAKWVLADYTLTFEVNGGSSVDALSVTHGANAVEPTAPTKDGYTFGGWFKEAELTNAFDFATEVITANTTIYAKWTLNVYNITFNTNGGSSVTNLSVNHGDKGTKPADPTKRFYNFAGWFKEEALTNAFDFTTETITANTTVYAKWELDTVNYRDVEIVLNGGMFPISSSSPILGIDPVSTHALGAFNSGYMDFYKESIFLFKKGYTGNTWAREIGLKLNDAGFYEVIQITAAGKSGTFDTCDYILVGHDAFGSGYKFLGTLQLGQIIAITGLDVMTAPNGKLDIPATVNVYPAGTYSVTNVKFAVNAELPNPYKADNNFIGWYDNAEFTGEKVTKVTANGKLYAKFEDIKYTVSFDEAGGSAVDDQVVVIKTKATEPTAPTKVGYTFAGWYKEPEMTNVFDFATEIITADITLYAKWTINSYTVTFNSNEGSEVPSQSVQHDGKVTEPLDPHKEGFGFVGWYSDVELTTPYNFDTQIIGEITLYAKWNSIIVANVNYAAVWNEDRGTWYIEVSLTDQLLDSSSVKSIKTVLMAGQYLAAPVELTPDTDTVLWFGVAERSASLSLKAPGQYAYKVVRMDDTVFTFTFNYQPELVTGLPEAIVANVDYNAVWNETRKTWYIQVSLDEQLDATTIKGISLIQKAGIYIDPVALTPDTDTVLWFGVAGEAGVPTLKEPGQYAYEVVRQDDSVYVFKFDYNPGSVLGLPDPTTATVDYTAVWNETRQTWYIQVSLAEQLDAATVKSIAMIRKANQYITPVLLTPDTDTVLWFGVADAEGSLAIKEAGIYTFEVVRMDDSSYAFMFDYNPALVIIQTITFNTNGGSAVEQLLVENGTTTIAPENPTKPGYTFLGWYTEAEFTNPFSFDTVITQNYTLYAKWELATYTLTLNYNEGTLKYPIYTRTEMIDAFLNDLYTFVGATESLSDFKHGAGNTTGYNGLWINNTTYKNKIYAGPRPTAVNEALFISSSAYMEKWLPFFDFMEYWVNFINSTQHFYAAGTYTGFLRLKAYITNVNPTGVSNATMALMPNEFVATPTTFTINSNAIVLPQLKKTGFTFGGWYNNAEFTGDALTTIAKGQTANVTLYAKWDPIA